MYCRWKLDKNLQSETWIGVFAGKVWMLQQDEDGIRYKVHEKISDENSEPQRKRKKSVDNEELLRNYLRLDVDLTEHYRNWMEADPYFKKIAQQFYGIRILNQEPVENIFSFICSSNNNITR